MDTTNCFVGQDKRDVGTWRTLIRAFLEYFQFNLQMLPTQEEIEGMHPQDNEGIRDYTYQWRQRTSNLKHLMSEEDMISTFLKILGASYQLILLTASTGNFADVINKATHVQLAIRAGLVTKVAIVPLSTNRATPRKATIIHLESNAVQIIEIPLSVQSKGYHH